MLFRDNSVPDCPPARQILWEVLQLKFPYFAIYLPGEWSMNWLSIVKPKVQIQSLKSLNPQIWSLVENNKGTPPITFKLIKPVLVQIINLQTQRLGQKVGPSQLLYILDLMFEPKPKEMKSFSINCLYFKDFPPYCCCLELSAEQSPWSCTVVQNIGNWDKLGVNVDSKQKFTFDYKSYCFFSTKLQDANSHLKSSSHFMQVKKTSIFLISIEELFCCN